MLGINLNGVNAAGGSTMVEPGGYVIEITKVKNNTTKFRLEFEFDIVKGPYAGYYSEFKEKYGWSKATFNKYYTEKAQSFFKKFIQILEDSNGGAPGLVVQIEDENGEPQEDIDETKLVGLQLGIVFGLEEKYSEKKGRVYKREDFYNAEFVTVEDILNGNYTVPDLKTLNHAQTAQGPEQMAVTDVVDTTAGLEPIKDDDIPF